MRGLTAATIIILSFFSTGCRREKIHLEPTEEGLVVLASRLNMADGNSAFQLVKGFHQVEGNAWRWTMGTFAATLRPPIKPAPAGVKLVVDFSVPDSASRRTGPVTLTASFEGKTLGSARCPVAGDYTLSAKIPPEAVSQEAVTFDFALDKYLKAGTLDGRELGVIVRSIGLEPI